MPNLFEQDTTSNAQGNTSSTQLTSGSESSTTEQSKDKKVESILSKDDHKEIKLLLSKIDDQLTSECPFCGKFLINMIENTQSRQVLSPFEYEVDENKQWEIL